MTEKKPHLVKGSMGTASLVLGILGLFLMPIPLSILAIIFGAIGMKDNQRFAKTGMILGIVGVTFVIILIILLTSLFVGVMSALV